MCDGGRDKLFLAVWLKEPWVHLAEGWSVSLRLLETWRGWGVQESPRGRSNHP